MQNNFDFLFSDPGMVAFAEVAMAANILHIDLAANILNCQRSMECES